MRKTMTFEELTELQNYVAKHHSVLGGSGLPGHRMVKYMSSESDFRTNDVFSIKLRGFGWDKHFHVMNEQRTHTRTIKDRVIAYLQGESDEVATAGESMGV